VLPRPRDYSDLGKGVKSEASYLDNQGWYERKTHRNSQWGGAPTSNLNTEAFSISTILCVEIIANLCLKPQKKCYTILEHDPSRLSSHCLDYNSRRCEDGFHSMDIGDSLTLSR
jgi:hypothetical protein